MSPSDFKDLGIGLAALVILFFALRYGYLGSAGLLKVISSLVKNIEASTATNQATVSAIKQINESMVEAHRSMALVSSHRDEQFQKLQTSIDSLPDDIKNAIVIKLDEALANVNGSVRELLTTLKELLKVQQERAIVDDKRQAVQDKADERAELKAEIKHEEDKKEKKSDGPGSPSS